MLTNNITRFLDQRKIEYKLHTLETDEKVSAEKVAEILNRPMGQIYKTIILDSGGKSKPIATLVAANVKVDSKKLAAALKEKKISPATQNQAEEITGMKVGGISPLGLINKPFRIVFDDSIKSLSTVIISAGVRGWQVELKPDDLIKLCNPRIFPISTK